MMDVVQGVGVYVLVSVGVSLLIGGVLYIGGHDRTAPPGEPARD